ncbi:Uncharacterised protein [Mycobacteroides abscessus]|uniref:hypothetical protein n=1 Tax=Mycobacteroides abscessus TaxID=36809 RepID=UPI0005E5A368|nr:hypothetical protein [Mycobacteroides abscessus]CPU39761.1 Uncharacterised protein [Mycobacteroides abscessus]CPU42948.1 Uncharacterised protein [Mycobacteroides abscessus]CPU60103.1 Uncharacterised protein [Mycobacteroides abscessus]CPV41516.1 Uncharacterised protein [Mycobacteroides abscessus]
MAFKASYRKNSRGYYVPMIRKTGQDARTFTLHTSKRLSSAEDARTHAQEWLDQRQSEGSLSQEGGGTK